MKKKEYIKPAMNILQLEASTILAGSYIQKASEQDYQEESVSSLRDADGGIWAD